MTIYFYSRLEPYGEFSNFAHYGVEVEGTYYPSVEHFFQAQKFVGHAHHDRILAARKPGDAARLGRSREVPLRADWEEVKDDVMRQGVRIKFQTHAELRDLLLGTGDQPIVENARGDAYWGCGADGSGRNMLGRILMEVRAEQRQGDAGAAS